MVIVLKYETLSKIFRKDISSHSDIYTARFNSPTTKHLDFIIKEFNRRKEYPAFFCYTEELFLLMERIYKKYERFSRTVNNVPPVVLQQFSLSCIVSEVKSTNDIEGVYSTRREIREILNGTAHSSRLSMIVKKYNNLVSGEHFDFNTCEDIRKFYDDFAHEEVATDIPSNKLDGKIFRKDSVSVTSATDKIIHQGVYPEEKIIESMKTALNILNNEEMPYLVRLAIFHYYFGYIHPFYDGNGRTIRFITSYYLAEHFHYLVALRLSLTIKKQRNKYYELFEKTTAEINCGDVTPFIIGFVSIIDKTFDEVQDTLSRKARQLDEYTDILSKKIPKDELTQNIYYLLLQAALFFGQGITITQLIKITGASRNTVWNRIKSIPKENIIVDKNQREYFYRLNMNIFKNKEN